MKITAQELANLDRLLSDLWERKIDATSYEGWRNTYGAQILDAHLTVGTLLRLAEPVEVEVVA